MSEEIVQAFTWGSEPSSRSSSDDFRSFSRYGRDFTRQAGSVKNKIDELIDDFFASCRSYASPSTAQEYFSEKRAWRKEDYQKRILQDASFRHSENNKPSSSPLSLSKAVQPLKDSGIAQLGDRVSAQFSERYPDSFTFKNKTASLSTPLSLKSKEQIKDAVRRVSTTYFNRPFLMERIEEVAIKSSRLATDWIKQDSDLCYLSVQEGKKATEEVLATCRGNEMAFLDAKNRRKQHKSADEKKLRKKYYNASLQEIQKSDESLWAESTRKTSEAGERFFSQMKEIQERNSKSTFNKDSFSEEMIISRSLELTHNMVDQVMRDDKIQSIYQQYNGNKYAGAKEEISRKIAENVFPFARTAVEASLPGAVRYEVDRAIEAESFKVHVHGKDLFENMSSYSQEALLFDETTEFHRQRCYNQVMGQGIAQMRASGQKVRKKPIENIARGAVEKHVLSPRYQEEQRRYCSLDNQLSREFLGLQTSTFLEWDGQSSPPKGLSYSLIDFNKLSLEERCWVLANPMHMGLCERLNPQAESFLPTQPKRNPLEHLLFPVNHLLPSEQFGVGFQRGKTGAQQIAIVEGKPLTQRALWYRFTTDYTGTEKVVGEMLKEAMGALSAEKLQQYSPRIQDLVNRWNTLQPIEKGRRLNSIFEQEAEQFGDFLSSIGKEKGESFFDYFQKPHSVERVISLKDAQRDLTFSRHDLSLDEQLSCDRISIKKESFVPFNPSDTNYTYYSAPERGVSSFCSQMKNWKEAGALNIDGQGVSVGQMINSLKDHSQKTFDLISTIAQQLSSQDLKRFDPSVQSFATEWQKANASERGKMLGELMQDCNRFSELLNATDSATKKGLKEHFASVKPLSSTAVMNTWRQGRLSELIHTCENPQDKSTLLAYKAYHQYMSGNINESLSNLKHAFHHDSNNLYAKRVSQMMDVVDGKGERTSRALLDASTYYMHQEDRQKAKQLLGEIMQKEPLLASPYLYRSQIHRVEGDLKQEAYDLQRAKSLNPLINQGKVEAFFQQEEIAGRPNFLSVFNQETISPELRQFSFTERQAGILKGRPFIEDELKELYEQGDSLLPRSLSLPKDNFFPAENPIDSISSRDLAKVSSLLHRPSLFTEYSDVLGTYWDRPHYYELEGEPIRKPPSVFIDPNSQGKCQVINVQEKLFTGPPRLVVMSVNGMASTHQEIVEQAKTYARLCEVAGQGLRLGNVLAVHIAAPSHGAISDFSDYASHTRAKSPIVHEVSAKIKETIQTIHEKYPDAEFLLSAHSNGSVYVEHAAWSLWMENKEIKHKLKIGALAPSCPCSKDFAKEVINIVAEGDYIAQTAIKLAPNRKGKYEVTIIPGDGHGFHDYVDKEVVSKYIEKFFKENQIKEENQ